MVEKPTQAAEESENPAPVEGEAAPPKPRPVILQKIIDRVQAVKDKILDFIYSREPHLVPTITTVIAVAILLSLGTWQMMRLQWKNNMIHSINEKLHEKTVDMQKNFPRTDAEWKKYDYRSVIVKGTWLPLHAFKIIPRTYEGEVGYHLVVPLKLPDNQIVFVNRGFVPDNAAILPTEEEKVFAVQGILKLPETLKPWATPENAPARGTWTWIDLAAMRHEIGVNSVVPVILYEAREEAQESYPIGGQLPVPFNNRHKQYALTWFALAFVFMGIWMIASSPKEKLKPTEEATAANDDDRMNDPVARRGLYPEATD